MRMTLSGNGILGGEWDSEKIDKQIAEEREKDRDYAEREAAYKAQLEKIDAYLGSFLKEQLEAEAALPPITDKVRSDFQRFQEACKRSGFPWLPADGSIVAEHLIAESGGAAEAKRLRDSISAVHLAMKLPDPTEDVLVKATIRWFKDNDEMSPRPRGRRRQGKLNGGASNKEKTK